MSKNKILLKQAALGILFGLFITIVFYFIYAAIINLNFTLDTFIAMHNDSLLLLIIDTFPIIFGLIFYVFSKLYYSRYNSLNSKYNKELKNNEITLEYINHINNDDFTKLVNDDENQSDLNKLIIELQNKIKYDKTNKGIREQEDNQRNWISKGFADFGELLRQDNDNIAKLAENILRELVKFVGANQGAFFMIKDDDNKKYLDLVASYAYERKKFVDRKIEMGNGLVGTCAIEGQSIYITDLPNDYINITSGLGSTNPSCILLVPLKSNDIITGVIEIANLKEFEKHEIEFIEKLAESIASTIISVDTNLKTRELLNKSQIQSAELANKELELRTNFSELEEIQEKTANNEIELRGLLTAIDYIVMELELNTKGHITSANNRFCETALHNHEDLKGTSVLDIFIDKHNKSCLENKKDLLSDNIFKGISKIYSQNKETYIWVVLSCTPVYDKNNVIFKYLFLATDITEQKRMEDELKNSEENLKIELSKAKEEIKEQFKGIEQEKVRNEMILEGMLDSILSINCKGLITFFNKASEDLWGHSKEDVIGQNVSMLFSKETIETDNFVSNLVDTNKETYVSVRQEVNIINKLEEESSVLMLISEAELNGNKTYTAFVQNIEMELF